MERINLTCECCHRVWDLEKTSEIPSYVFFMRCNFCIDCDLAGRMDAHYEEWWDEDENSPDKPTPIPVGENQLCFPFIFDEIGVPKLTPEIA